jgi:DNA-binding NarL/FixJ family response regulator
VEATCGRDPIVAPVGRGETDVAMIHVALLDDHPAVLAGLRRLIAAEPDLEVIGAAARPPELARQIGDLHPDVLILDFDPSRGDGLAHCRRIKDRPHPPAVLMYSAYAGPALSLAASLAHADAVVDKADSVQNLLHAIRRIARGETSLPPVSRDTYDAAIARIDPQDLPVLAMLLAREPVEAIAHTLRTSRDEIAWRAQRIVGRLRPTIGARAEARTPTGIH